MNYKQVAFIIALVLGTVTSCIISQGVKADELRIELAAFSKHFPEGNYNGRHPTLGFEYQKGSTYYTASSYIDSYYKKSYLLSAGKSVKYHFISAYAEAGLTYKGVVTQRVGPLKMMTIPFVQTGLMIEGGSFSAKAGFVPIPAKFGSSVGFLMLGWRIGL